MNWIQAQEMNTHEMDSTHEMNTSTKNGFKHMEWNQAHEMESST